MANENALERQDGEQDAVYLRFLPDHLREIYQEGLQDKQLTHLRRQVALMEVRVKTLLRTLDHQVMTPEKMSDHLRSDFPQLGTEMADQLGDYFSAFLPEGFIDSRTFRSLQRLVTKYESAMSEKRLIPASEALGQLFTAIEQGRRDGEIWKEIDGVMDSQRKLIEAEERRIVQTQSMMSAEQTAKFLFAVIQSIQDAVVLYVSEREVQELILAAAQRIYRSRLTGVVDLQPDADGLDRQGSA